MPHGHDVERFNRMADRYEHHWLQHIVFDPIQRTVLDLAAEEVAQPGKILDVGCGTGRLLRSAAVRFPNATLTGVDPAGEMLKQAETLKPEGSAMHFQEGTAEALPFPDDQFDLVFSTLAFHHWNDQAKGIGEIGRVLTPAGRWVVADVMPTGLIGSILRVFRMHQFPPILKFESMLSAAQLRMVTQRRVPGLGGQLNAVAIAR